MFRHSLNLTTAAAVSAAVAAFFAPPSSADGPAAASSRAAEMPVVDCDGLKKLVAAQRGKVVLLDFWATWCKPCVEGLPHLADHQKKFGGRGLHIIAVSFDDARQRRRAMAVLARAGWHGPSVIVKDRAEQEKIVDWLASRWRSELPAQYIFDRAGTPIREVIEVTADDLPPLPAMLDQALSSAASAPASSATRL